MICWAERLEEAQAVLGMSQRAFARHLGVTAFAVRVWSLCQSEPYLRMAVQVSLRLGYSLDAMISAARLRRRDFAPEPLAVGSSNGWADRLSEIAGGATRFDTAKRVAERALQADRTTWGWMAYGKDPTIVRASEVAEAFDVRLHWLATGEGDRERLACERQGK